MRAQQQAIARGLLFLPGDEQRVLRVARRMVRRKIQRLEVVVVGLDLRAFANRVAHRLEDGDDLVHHAQHRMFHTDGTLNARQRNVEAFGGELRICAGGVELGLSFFNGSFRTSLQCIDALSDLALRRAGSGFQPGVVYLRQDAILAGQPAVAEVLPVGLVRERRCLRFKRSKQISDGAVKSVRGVVVEFRYGVHDVG